MEEGGEDGQSSVSKRAKRNVPKSVIPVIAVKLRMIKMSLVDVTTLYQIDTSMNAAATFQ